MTRTRQPRISFLLIVILLVSWGLMLINLDAPWWEQGGDNGAWISSAVQNYQRYGALELGLMQVLNYEPSTPAHYDYYSHHPPIIVWQTALASATYGFRELSFRYSAAIMTLISTVALYLLVRRLTNEKQALWATALYAFTPMMLFYGRMPDHEAPALAFGLLLFAVVVNTSHKITRARLFAICLLTFLCAWTAWAILIFVGYLGLWVLWLNPKRNWRVFLLIGGVAVGSVVVLLLYYQSQWSEAIPDLLDVFFFRTGNQQLSRNSGTFTFGEYLWQNFIHIISLYTPSMLFLVVIGWLFAWKRGNRRTKSMIVVLMISAITYFLVFRNATYIHNYYKIYLAPAFALSASYAMIAGSYYFGRKRRVISAIMQGFLLGGIITGGFFFGLLHQSAVRPMLDVSRALLAEYSEPGDIVYTNLDYGIRPLSLYAEIALNDTTEPVEIIALADDGRTFDYLYCNADNVEDFELPAELESYDVIEREMCFYVQIERDE